MPHAPTAQDHSAAIFFAADAYDPEGRGINGRRIAGQSFLQGYLRHMGDGPFTGCVNTPEAERAMIRACRALHPAREVTAVRSYQSAMRGIGTLFYPSPNLDALAWPRMAQGHAAWSLCGLTHSLSTRKAMQHVAALVTSPVQPWDALICTSRAARAAVEAILDAAEAHVVERFGGRVPERLALPVIPLGIDTASFARDDAAGQGMRAEMGIARDGIVAMTLSRLSFIEKFDPLPLFRAMQLAAPQTGAPLHMMLVGAMAPDANEAQFRKAAAALMPDVTLHIVSPASNDQRRAALSAADMFLFPIDNIQETFGLAVVEAMAAGLPVIATDWDGLRDTVSADSGILIPTLTGNPGHARPETHRFLTETDSYHQFLSVSSALSGYEPQWMARAIVTLATDPALRARMGEAGRRRAHSLFDWAAVVPQMQELWAWQNARRAAAPDEGRAGAVEVPVMPSVFRTFAAWPSAQLGAPGTLCVVVATGGAALPSPAEIHVLRGYDRMQRMTEPLSTLEKVLSCITHAGGPLTTAEIADRCGIGAINADRAALWLIKYGYMIRADFPTG